MKSAILFLSVFVFTSIEATHADYQLVNNGKTVVCFGDDNQSWTLNKSRTTVKYVIEGESLGPKKVIRETTDHESYSSFVTEEGTLTLDNRGDKYKFANEDESFPVECK